MCSPTLVLEYSEPLQICSQDLVNCLQTQFKTDIQSSGEQPNTNFKKLKIASKDEVIGKANPK